MADNGIILVYGGKWSSLQEKLLSVADTSSRMGNTVVSEVAAIGRRSASGLYKGANLTMGGTYWKSWVKNPEIPRGTIWDDALGGYASKTHKIHGRGLREMGFSFENKKNQKSKTRFVKSISRASMYSLTANLWEYDHNMGGKPENYRWSYNHETWSAWQKGAVRKARPFFLSGVKGKVVASMGKAVDRTESKYREELAKL